MSADLWLLHGECVDESCGFAHELFHMNVTYNLSPMLREAGWVWDSDTLEGVRAADIGEAVLAVQDRLRADPERFKALDPPNGWGTYDGLVESWDGFVRAVEHFPDARIHVWL